MQSTRHALPALLLSLQHSQTLPQHAWTCELARIPGCARQTLNPKPTRECVKRCFQSFAPAPAAQRLRVNRRSSNLEAKAPLLYMQDGHLWVNRLNDLFVYIYNMCIYISIYIYIIFSISIILYIYVYIYVYTNIDMYIYIHVYIYVYVYIYTYNWGRKTSASLWTFSVPTSPPWEGWRLLCGGNWRTAPRRVRVGFSGLRV